MQNKPHILQYYIQVKNQVLSSDKGMGGSYEAHSFNCIYLGKIYIIHKYNIYGLLFILYFFIYYIKYLQAVL